MITQPNMSHFGLPDSEKFFTFSRAESNSRILLYCKRNEIKDEEARHLLESQLP